MRDTVKVSRERSLPHQLLAFVDLETTGIRPTSDRVIEIAVLIVQQGKLIQQFKTLINPEKSVPQQIVDLTGLSSLDLAQAPTFAEVAPDLARLLQGALLVAHNVRFDYGFLKNEFRRVGIPFRARTLCTVKLSRSLFPEYRRHDLASIIARFNFDCPRHHRALDDVLVLWQFWQMISETMPTADVERHISRLTRSSLPLHLPPEVIDRLPTGPGVYLFYGPDRELLYVGKSIHIKRRVQSHFSSDHGQSRRHEMVQQIHDIEAEETVSDLAASLLELQLIKTREPLYNRASRRYRKLWALVETKDDKGYLSAVVTELGTITPQTARSIVGLFRSRQKAIEYRRNLTKEHHLCSKKMNDEKGRGRCFLAQTDVCAGACIGQEVPRDYNRRVRQAFKARRVRQWPYRGPVILREGSAKDSKGELFIIDQWCLVGAFRSDTTGTRPFLETLSGTFFEFDTYKVLVRHLLQSHHSLEMVTADQIPSLLRTELGIADYHL